MPRHRCHVGPKHVTHVFGYQLLTYQPQTPNNSRPKRESWCQLDFCTVLVTRFGLSSEILKQLRTQEIWWCTSDAVPISTKPGSSSQCKQTSHCWTRHMWPRWATTNQFSPTEGKKKIECNRKVKPFEAECSWMLTPERTTRSERNPFPVSPSSAHVSRLSPLTIGMVTADIIVAISENADCRPRHREVSSSVLQHAMSVGPSPLTFV